MAISHVQPLFLLLASLFFLPTLRVVDFEYCNKNGYDFGTVTNVEISPNPIGLEDYELSITVFGHIKERIGKGVIEVYAKSENITDLLGRFDLCSMGAPCPIEAGSKFVLPLPEVPKDVLEGDYKYVVALLEVVAASEEPTPRMCVDFDLPTSALTLVLLGIYALIPSQNISRLRILNT